MIRNWGACRASAIRFAPFYYRPACSRRMSASRIPPRPGAAAHRSLPPARYFTNLFELADNTSADMMLAYAADKASGASLHFR